MSKVCFKCKEKKPVEEFYKHPQMLDGRINKCKACNKKDVIKNYRKNKDHYNNYERTRAKDPDRKKSVADYQRKRRALYPEKNRARQSVSNALRSGKLEREPCQVCGKEKSQAHHEDYSKPLDVQWLCFEHHRMAHGQLNF